MVHSLGSLPAPVQALLKERGFSIRISRSWEETEQAYSVVEQIRYVLIDTTLCCRNGWEKFIDKVSAAPSGAILICFHPRLPDNLYNLLDHFFTKLESNKTEENPLVPLVVGESPKFRKALELANRYAQHDITVLVTGETGTGKELISRYVHAYSSRKNKPLVACNIAAIPETLVESELFGYVKGAFTGADKNKRGLIEAAEGGTLFLDEIGDLQPSIQLKLLRFLESREFYKVGDSSAKTANVRVIASTNKDLLETTNVFRRDLYYRLNSARIILPPLREHREDIILLAEKFVEQSYHQTQKPLKKISSSANALLLDYPWPGNIRELRNVIESAVMVSDGEYLTIGDLSMELQQYATMHREEFSTKAIRSLEEAERTLIVQAMKETNGNKGKAAELLGISTRTLYRKLEKFPSITRDSRETPEEVVADSILPGLTPSQVRGGTTRFTG